MQQTYLNPKINPYLHPYSSIQQQIPINHNQIILPQHLSTINPNPQYIGQPINANMSVVAKNNGNGYYGGSYQGGGGGYSNYGYLPGYNNSNIQDSAYNNHSPRNIINQKSNLYKNTNEQLIVNNSKWNLDNGNGSNITNFPFGKDRAQLHNYVTQQMKTETDQQNKKIIQKFRMDAIRNRNQKVMKHLGKIPYVTESMMPGTNIDVNQFVEKQKEKYGKYIKPITSLDASFSKSRSKQNQNLSSSYVMPVSVINPLSVPISNGLVNNSMMYLIDPKYVVIPTQNTQQNSRLKQHQTKRQKVIIPRKDPNSKTSTVGISVNFQQQFPLSPRKPKSKPRNNKNSSKNKYYTIQQQQQLQSINKIQNMLHKINNKLKKNSRLLQESLYDNVPLSKSRLLTQPKEFNDNEDYQSKKRFSYSRRNYFTQSVNQDVLPSVVYSSNNYYDGTSKTHNGDKTLSKFRSKTQAQQHPHQQHLRNKSRISNQNPQTPSSISSNKKYIKQHLQLLKNNRKRMDELDEFVYKY